ncbi:MAG: hypothetical protein R3F65_09700 [bacterium]|nr:hypothetical protein [Myxococcales bacterium]
MKAWLAALELVCVAVFVAAVAAAVARAEAVEAARRAAARWQGGSFAGGGVVVTFYSDGCRGPRRPERRDRDR